MEQQVGQAVQGMCRIHGAVGGPILTSRVAVQRGGGIEGWDDPAPVSDEPGGCPVCEEALGGDMVRRE